MVRVISSHQSKVLLVVLDAEEEMTVITGGAASSGPETLGDKLVLLHRGGEEDVGSLVDAGLVSLLQSDLCRAGNNLLQTFLPKPGPAGLALSSDQGDGVRSPALLSCSSWTGQVAGGGGGQVQLLAGQTVAVSTLQVGQSVLARRGGRDLHCGAEPAGHCQRNTGRHRPCGTD